MTEPDSTRTDASEEGFFRHSQVTVGNSSVHMVECGSSQASPIMFLHGWPESWEAWRSVMRLAGNSHRAIAIDLPGVGGSICDGSDGTKRQIANTIHELIVKMGLKDVDLVGQDVGGMVVYSYLRMFDDLAHSVIMDVVIPGLDPWDDVLRNRHIWHFALHNVPELPEALVQGRQNVYFDYFYNTLSAVPARITAEARTAYVNAYSSDRSLKAGFDWYRAFDADAKMNREPSGRSMATPLLYLRGEHEPGDIGRYVQGLEDSGMVHVESGIVPGAGHFTQEEAPQEVWRIISQFIGDRT